MSAPFVERGALESVCLLHFLPEHQQPAGNFPAIALANIGREAIP